MNSKFSIISFLLLVFPIICSCGTSVQEYKAKNDDEKDITNLLIRYNEIVNLGDGNKILELFHENGVYVTPRGRETLSREEISKRDWLEAGPRNLFNPKIQVNGNESTAIVEVRFGNYKVPKVFNMTKENNKWLITKIE